MMADPRGFKKPPLGTHGRAAFDQLLMIEGMRLSKDEELKAFLLNLTGLVAALYDDLEKSGALRPPRVTPPAA